MNLFKEGISFDNDKFIINMNTDDYDNDIIFINTTDIFVSKLADCTYTFGYKFNDDVDSTIRTRFIKWLKTTDMTPDLESFILKPVKHLYKTLNIDDIDCLVYPISQRSNLVNNIIATLNYVLPHKTIKRSVELIKNLPSNITFDWDSFNSNYEGVIGDSRYKQIQKYINETLLPKIHSLDYFSIARDVKAKHRKYIQNYLIFKDSDSQQLYNSIKSGNILIVDDINTTGSTLSEIVKTIHAINSDCNIYIFTLIGK